MSRLPEFDPNALDAAQESIYNAIVSGPRGKFGGPFYALIYAPGIAGATQELGAALRFSTKLDPRYREIAILVAARFWRNAVEWNAHVPIAINSGVAEECIGGILQREMPESTASDDRLVYRFCLELLEQKLVSDALYSETEALVGVEQLVELVSVIGYFGLLAMQLNTFRIAPNPADGDPPAHLTLPAISPTAEA
jgi:4-carboxymuconolactone decarboxylase